MAVTVLSSPFGTEPIDDVVLTKSPLVRVLAQVRYPRLFAMSAQNAESTTEKISSLLGQAYPILDRQQQVQITLGPDGASQVPGEQLWLLRSSDQDWQITLATNFVAVETKSYESRAAFVERLRAILVAVGETISPPFAERIGIRYTNRIDDQVKIHDIDQLVRPEVVGGVAVPRPGGVNLVHTISESLYQATDFALHARWGLLPPGGNIDPGLPPVDQNGPNWVLDLDSFQQEQIPFDVDALVSRAGELASNAYRYFRWVVTPEFISAFGGPS